MSIGGEWFGMWMSGMGTACLARSDLSSPSLRFSFSWRCRTKTSIDCADSHLAHIDLSHPALECASSSRGRTSMTAGFHQLSPRRTANTRRAWSTPPSPTCWRARSVHGHRHDPAGADFVALLGGLGRSMRESCWPYSDRDGSAPRPKTGRPLLDNPNDFVRWKISRGARARHSRRAVLLDGAPMPDPDNCLTT